MIGDHICDPNKRMGLKRCGKTIVTPLRLIARMNFSLKNYSCELFNLIGTVGKVELISFQLKQLRLFAKAG